jgi:carboxymethylenebutenolidase
LKAAVAWYGQLRAKKTPSAGAVGPLDVAAQMNPPILGLYSEADLGTPVEASREWRPP